MSTNDIPPEDKRQDILQFILTLMRSNEDKYEARWEAQDKALVLTKSSVDALMNERDRRFSEELENVRRAISGHEQLSQSREKGIAERLEGMLDKTKAVREEMQIAADQRYAQEHQSWTGAIANLKELMAQAMAMSERAINKAESAVEKRLENTNEWRNAMNDRDRQLMSAPEGNARMNALKEQIEKQDKVIAEQDKRIASLLGQKNGMKDGWGWAAAVIAMVVAVLAVGSAFMFHTASAQPTVPQVIYVPAPQGVITPNQTPTAGK
jgi:hypothetical protein